MAFRRNVRRSPHVPACKRFVSDQCRSLIKSTINERLRRKSLLLGRSVWALGVHINVLDLAEAVAAAVRCTAPVHSRLLLCAADIASAQPTSELVAERVPHIPWRGGQEYEADPFRALVDISKAQQILNWRPVHTLAGTINRPLTSSQETAYLKRARAIPPRGHP